MSLYAISETDFQTIVLSLLDGYSSQTIAHVGYIVGLTIGIAAILYQVKFKDFFKDYQFWKRILFFYTPLSMLTGSIFFVGLRLQFWSWLTTTVLRVPYGEISNKLANSIDPFYTPVWAIQDYCVTLYRYYFPDYSYLFDQYGIALILVFSIPIIVAAIIIDILWNKNRNKVLKVENKKKIREKEC